MAPLPDYVAGTITLTNGSTAFTGSGTGWLAAGFREGDTILGIEDNPGVVYVVESVTDNDSGTLTQPWDGPTGTYTYRMRYLSDGQRVTAQARQLIEMLGNGNLQAVAGLPGTPNTLMMFTGAGSVVEVPRTDLVSGASYDVQVDTLAERAAYDGSDEGFAVLVANTGDGRAAIYSKNSATSGDWSDPAYVTGPAVTLDVGSVTPIAFGNDPDVTLNPVAGGYEFDFELPENATFESGTITTLDPGEDATFSLSPVAGGYALNLGVPRGPTGDIDGVTPFWQDRITVDATAEAARAGLGAAAQPLRTSISPTNQDFDLLIDPGPFLSLVSGVQPNGWGGSDYGYLTVERFQNNVVQTVEPYIVGSQPSRRRTLYGGVWSDWDSDWSTLTMPVATPVEAQELTGTAPRAWSPERIAQAVAARYWLSIPLGQIVFVDVSDPANEYPPIDAGFVMLSTGKDGSGEYNEGKVTNELISGSGATLVATFDIDDDESPFDGQTWHCLNDEERVIYAGSSAKSGDVFNDQFQRFDVQLKIANNNVISANTYPMTSTRGNEGIFSAADVISSFVASGANGTPRTGDRTRAKGQFLVAFRRYKRG